MTDEHSAVLDEAACRGLVPLLGGSKQALLHLAEGRGLVYKVSNSRNDDNTTHLAHAQDLDVHLLLVTDQLCDTIVAIPCRDNQSGDVNLIRNV